MSKENSTRKYVFYTWSSGQIFFAVCYTLVVMLICFLVYPYYYYHFYSYSISVLECLGNISVFVLPLLSIPSILDKSILWMSVARTIGMLSVRLFDSSITALIYKPRSTDPCWTEHTTFHEIFRQTLIMQFLYGILMVPVQIMVYVCGWLNDDINKI